MKSKKFKIGDIVRLKGLQPNKYIVDMNYIVIGHEERDIILNKSFFLIDPESTKKTHRTIFEEFLELNISEMRKKKIKNI